MIFLTALLVAGVQAYLLLDLEVLTGNSFTDKGVGRSIEVVKRDDGVIDLSNHNQYYMAELQIGSNEQKIGVLVDTGSSDLWVATLGCNTDGISERDMKPKLRIGPGALDTAWSPNFRNEEREYYDKEDCTSNGVFDPNNLISFVRNETADPFSIEYKGGAFAQGYWGSDVVKLGSYAVDDFVFAVATRATSQSVMGIGLTENESSSGGSKGKDSGFTYPNFPSRLMQDGIIRSHTYSIFLGPNNASEAKLLFGAVDHGRYDGDLKRVKLVNIYKDIDYPLLRFDIVLDGILGDGFTHQDQTSALLDTGASLLLLPWGYVNKLRGFFDPHGELPSDPSESLFKIDCKYLNLTELVSFFFSGIRLQMPVRDLVFQSGGCYLGVKPTSTSSILGANFLRNIYVVFDMDNKEVALAQAAASEQPSTIEEIISLIPLALEAPYYSNTDLEDYYVTRLGNVYYGTGLATISLHPLSTEATASQDLGNTILHDYQSVPTSLSPVTTSQGLVNTVLHDYETVPNSGPPDYYTMLYSWHLFYSMLYFTRLYSWLYTTLYFTLPYAWLYSWLYFTRSFTTIYNTRPYTTMYLTGPHSTLYSTGLTTWSLLSTRAYTTELYSYSLYSYSLYSYSVYSFDLSSWSLRQSVMLSQLLGSITATVTPIGFSTSATANGDAATAKFNGSPILVANTFLYQIFIWLSILI